MTKVLMMSDGYPPELGGLESHVAGLTGYLARRGLDVLVVTRVNPMIQSDTCDGNMRVLRCLDIPQPYRMDSPIRAALSIRTTLKKLASSFDLIHYHGMFTEAFIGLRAKMPPMVLTVHGHFLSCPRYTRTTPTGQICPGKPTLVQCMQCMAQGGIFRALAAPLAASWTNAVQKARVVGAREFEHIVCVSESVRSHSEKAVRSTKSSVIHNFVGPIVDSAPPGSSNFEPLGIDSDSFVTLFSARLSPEKGLGVLLKAWKSFRRNHSDSILVITGSGPQSSLAQAASMEARNGILFLGRVDRQLLVALMRRANVFALPSIWEDPCPTAGLEALSLGTPVAGSNLGGIPEMLQQCQSCLLFNPFDNRSVVGTLKKMYDRRNDAKQVVLDQTFTLEYVGRSVESLYTAILQSRHRSRHGSNVLPGEYT